MPGWHRACFVVSFVIVSLVVLKRYFRSMPGVFAVAFSAASEPLSSHDLPNFRRSGLFHRCWPIKSVYCSVLVNTGA